MRNSLIDSGLLALLEGRDLNIRSLTDGLFGGNRRSGLYGSSAEFADFRDYSPGDDPRRIDWNLYGRLDRLYLRLYKDERRQHHRVLIDSSASMAFGAPEKHHAALQMAAVLGYLAVNGMDVVSYYSLQGANCLPVGGPVSGREAWYQITELLDGLSCRGDTRIDEAVMNCPDPGHHSGITFLISDLLTDSDWKRAVDGLLQKNHDVCLIRVLSREEISPSFSGRLLLRDAEAADEADPRNRRMEISRRRLKAYAEAYRWLEADIRAFCAARRVRFLQFCTDEEMGRVLFTRSVESEMIL